MNWDSIMGKWKQYSGEVKKHWGKLTDDELLQVNGDREILAGKIQEKYGVARDEAHKQIDEWADKLKT
ncbi:MAG: CsbD family protein [Anaerolineae bacterium]|nr:CsbD family protein [Anaerolineae bacterium]